jgi:hypothetical protein
MTMKPGELIHTAEVNGHPIRFFRTPLNDGRPDFVWHSLDDLETAMGVLRSQRRAMLRMIKKDKEWGPFVRTVATKDGVVSIAPHFLAQGRIGAAMDSQNLPASFEMAYRLAALEAQRIMDDRIGAGAQSLEYIGAAFHRWSNDAPSG